MLLTGPIGINDKESIGRRMNQIILCNLFLGKPNLIALAGKAKDPIIIKIWNGLRFRLAVFNVLSISVHFLS